MTSRSSVLARLVAVLLFAGVPALAMALGAGNFVAVLSGRNEIREGESRLAALSDRLDLLDPQGGVDTSRLYLDGDTPSLAAADLRRRLTEAITAAGGELVETRNVESDPAEGESVTVLLAATFDIDNAGLARLLYTLESGAPLMEMADLALRRIEAEGRDDDPVLRADLTVKAFRKDAAT